MGDNTDPLHRPRPDDGRGAAVHLRGHLQDGQHARGGHGRRGRAAPHRRLAARPQGGRHLPRQLQGRPAAARRRRRTPTPPTRAAPPRPTEVVERIVEKIVHEPVRQKLPRTRASQDLRVPGGRLQGLRHRRRVRGRPSGRDLRPGLQAGLDPRRHHGRLRHLGQPRPPVRRAAAQLRRGLHRHALRAGRHDRRSRHPHRQLADGLPLPPPGPRVPVRRGAGRAGHPHHRRAHAAHAAGRRGDRRRDPSGLGDCRPTRRRSSRRRRSSPRPRPPPGWCERRTPSATTPPCACSAAC